MTVAIITEAESEELVSLQSVKSALRIEGDGQDGNLETLIAQVSSDFVEHLGRPLALQVYRERQEFYGHCPGINLSRGPLCAIQSMQIDGTPWGDPLDECDVDRRHARVVSTAFLPPNSMRSSGRHVVEVVYAAGYLLPGAVAPEVSGSLLPMVVRPLPPGISGACINTIQMLLSAQGRDPLLKTESVEGVGSASWRGLDAISGALSPDAVAALSTLHLAADWMA
ncbi:MAG: phage head-tail connector protein [Acetobacter sp.]|jgi:hypothetical protein|nr:phage head-tail connector protein [Acetobacter sp.]MCH4060487.1 phage head-tail connector protein [Acetobacter sp.]MCH4087427.1 phage head-tail connector protein [Acetobacter sp.]MCI1293945.1 phage head-tail connector protein [Acetobacter sp.]MCI1320461.1 phage head-tail connector protein [Acetobacter sp.]